MKPTRAQRKAIHDYVDELRCQMWLGSWQVNIEWEESKERDDGLTCTGRCLVTPEYREVTITLNPTLIDEHETTLQECLVHELVHCHVAPTQTMLEDAISTLSPSAAAIATEFKRKHIEDLVTVMTRLIVKAMPAFEKPKAGK